MSVGRSPGALYAHRVRPYYSDDHVTIYHGDCREVTEWLAADVMVTDPPYGMAYVGNFGARSTRSIRGDQDTAARDAAIEVWGPRPALVFGIWRSARPAHTRHLLVWDKGAIPGNGDLRMPWGNSAEEVYVLGEGFVPVRCRCYEPVEVVAVLMLGTHR